MNPAIEVLLQRLKATDEISEAFAHADANLARRMVLWMIDEARPVPETVTEVLDGIATLHSRENEAEPVEPSEWRAMREQAVVLSEEPDAATQRAAGIAEAAAWPVAKSRSILSELLNALTTNAWKAGSAGTGWTPQDEAHAHEVLSGFHAEGLDREQIPARFAEVNPELSGRFVAQLNAANAAALAMPGQVLEALQRLKRENA